MSLLIVALFYINYQKELQNLDKELLSKMHLCNYSLDCKEFKIDFVAKSKQLTYTLYKSENEISSLYPVKDSADYFLKIYLSYDDYHKRIHYLHKELVIYLLITLSIVVILSILFSFYALHPLRKALLLTREFVKDILHDFNTPISTMRLNLSLLQKEFGENSKIKRIERSIDNILLLQENLRHYLLHYQMVIETLNLQNLVKERVEMIERNYPKLKYSIEIPLNITLKSNKKALTRIIDNIISNASKYNKEDGKLIISYDPKSKTLKITDTGKGIADPSRAFERFYKEHERGMGIGLHIVKKLCDELDIKVSIESQLDVGTTLFLKF